MTWDKLRRHKVSARRLPQKSPFDFEKYNMQYVRQTVPAKEVVNTKGDMNILDMYVHGVLKWPDTGRTCGNCVNYYPDKSAKYGGRCKARGYMQTHEDTPADEQKNGWYHPVENVWFPYWPECPLFIKKERLSRR